MQVIKRNGQREDIRLDKITDRVKYLSKDLSVDPVEVPLKVMNGIHDGITSKQIDQLLSETAAVLSIQNPDYTRLAGRILVSCLHKETSPSFYESMKKLNKEGLLDEKFYRKVRQNRDALDKMIVHERDFDLDYIGIRTLSEGYLMGINDVCVERPQHMWMRVAVAITVNDEGIESARQLYNLFSTGQYTHATPTLYNAGTKHQQLSSCFLVPIEDDTMESITRSWTTYAMISKEAGGIGTYISRIRGTGSRIRKRGISKGIIPLLRVMNTISEYVDQGGKRPGTIAVYLEPWHNDIFKFIDIKKNTGEEKSRARSLFAAMWIPDLFMKRVEADGMWSLFSPSQIDVDLTELYDEETTGGSFTQEYTRLEAEGKFTEQVKARDLWTHILNAQTEGGRPYMMYKDTVNRLNNQKHIGTIRGSNLCTEIVEFSGIAKDTDELEVAVCNLASIVLQKYVVVKNGVVTFDHARLGEVVRIAVRSLNKVIDINHYPTIETKRSNLRHRPIGVGVQGLADVFFMFSYAFDSKEAEKLNKEIFETIYYNALVASNELATELGTYETYPGSPVSKGILHTDYYKVDPTTENHDWPTLRGNIAKTGLRNSLLVALMPTQSTANLFGSYEGFEAQPLNIFRKRLTWGEPICVNRYLVSTLIKLGLWTTDIQNRIKEADGSVQHIAEIPADIRAIYKCAGKDEISQKQVIEMAAARQPFVDQAQSMNLYFAKPTTSKLHSAHMHSWRTGCKTGMYYLRTDSTAGAVKVTTSSTPKVEYTPEEKAACSLANPESCGACGS